MENETKYVAVFIHDNGGINTLKQKGIESAVILMIMFQFIIAVENSSLQVQTAAETVQKKLVEKGFENVVVRQKSDELTIEYENRR